MGGVAISSATLANVLRGPVQDIQNRLAQAQTELSTGRAADIGLTLGVRTGHASSLHQARARLDVFGQTNAIVGTRLKATDAVLTSISDTLQRLQGQAVAAQAGTAAADAIAGIANSAIGTTLASLNTAVDGQHLFSGVNTDVRPFADQGASGAQAVANAFSAAFGMTPSDPAASTIAPAAMQSFLDGPLAALFAGPAWSRDWSSASSAPITTRISPTEVATTSVTANDAALRGTVQALSALADLGLPQLSAQTRSVVLTHASGLLGQATRDVAALQSHVGLIQTTLSAATDDVARTGQFIDAQIGSLENVDPAEVSTQIASLTTQLESAYALTGKLSKLSLVAYLP